MREVYGDRRKEGGKRDTQPRWDQRVCNIAAYREAGNTAEGRKLGGKVREAKEPPPSLPKTLTD